VISFAQLRAVQPGFEPRGVVTFWQALPKASYGKVDQQTQFFDKLLAKLTALPGIEDAGASQSKGRIPASGK